MDSLIQFFVKNGEITTNGFVLFLAIVGYIVHKYDLREIKQTITTLSETTSEKIAALSEKLATLSENVKSNTEKITEIREVLLSKKIIKPYVVSKSPKQITESGTELLEKYNVPSFIDSCDLVNQNHSDKLEFEVFLECLDWVKNNAKRKVYEMIYEDDIDEGDCTMLLACAIRDRILEGEKQTTP